jgi:hypothetical protein
MKLGSGTRRVARIAGVAVSVALLLLGATRLSRLLFDRPAEPRRVATASTGNSSPAVVPVEVAILQVTAASGQISTYRDGQWIPLQKGDLLSLQDVVRTSAGASAVLGLGGSIVIELREKVEIRLDKVTNAGAAVELRRGQVAARVAGAVENLEIVSRETRTSNEGPALFVVRADENGRVSVASKSGRVLFKGAGKTVTVPEGNESRAEPNQAPGEPEKIPEEVFLTVVWPDAERHGAEASIQGRAAATSLVTVNGETVAVDTDGSFKARVPLKEGSNNVLVEAESLIGRSKQARHVLVRPSTRPPKLAPVRAPLWSPK